jgi:hypothetical protein
VCSLVLFLSAAQPVLACKAYSSADIGRLDGSGNPDMNANFNDFAFILDSAGDPYCTDVAAIKLGNKLASMNQNPAVWKTWLAGGSVSFVMASGLTLGTLGQLSDSLDKKIRDVANAYEPGTDPGVCGFDNGNWVNGNTCLEDYGIDASAHGWRAAYYRHTGRDEWTTARSKMVTAANKMLDPATTCIRFLSGGPFVPTGRGICNASFSDLGQVPAVAEIVTLNHRQQSLAYGIGQMTSLASAFVGLDVAERRFNTSELLANRAAMAGYLFAEASPRSSATGANSAVFSATGCYAMIGVGTASTLDPGKPCSDTQVIIPPGHPSTLGPSTPYRADMFKMKDVYDTYALPKGGATGFMFDRFNNIFLTGPNDWDKIWGIGRLHFYYGLGSASVVTKPWMQGRNVYVGGIKRGSYFTTAANNANVTLGATTRSSSTPSLATMTLTDNNYGSLRNGDSVSIKNMNGQYWSATGGGGSSVVTVAFNPSTLTIVKLTQTNEIIAHGDQFAIRTPSGHYLTAPTFGGNVTATSTTIGTYQTFTLDRTKYD